MENTTTTIAAYTNNSLEPRNRITGIWLAVAAYLVGAFTACSNIMVIRAVMTTEVLKTRANMYVISLAFSDALVGVLQLIIGTHYLPTVSKRFDEIELICVGMFSFISTACVGSALNICLIALDRYFYIVRPLQYQRLASEKKVKVIIICVWATAGTVGASPFLINNFDTAQVCTMDEVIPQVFNVAFSIFVASCSVTFVVYVRLGWLSYRTMKTISQARGHLGFQLQAAASHSEATSSPRTPTVPHRFSRGSLKSLKMLVMMFGFLVVFWSPYFILTAISVFGQVSKVDGSDVCLIFGFCNSGVNAFIYPYFNRDFRETLKKMLSCN